MLRLLQAFTATSKLSSSSWQKVRLGKGQKLKIPNRFRTMQQIQRTNYSINPWLREGRREWMRPSPSLPRFPSLLKVPTQSSGIHNPWQKLLFITLLLTEPSFSNYLLRTLTFPMSHGEVSHSPIHTWGDLQGQPRGLRLKEIFTHN